MSLTQVAVRPMSRGSCQVGFHFNREGVAVSNGEIAGQDIGLSGNLKIKAGGLVAEVFRAPIGPPPAPPSPPAPPAAPIVAGSDGNRC
jgi:hypothetical protein